jgi:copper ion binding protein
MRKFFFFLAIILLGASCSSGNKKSSPSTETQILSAEHLIEVKFDVKGMTCEGCENAVKSSINKLEGIKEVTASFKAEESVVKYDSTLVSSRLITEAIESAGYEVAGFKE